MFVVNANSQNNGGGASSVSGYYDAPMNGSTYNMFSSKACASPYTSITAILTGNQPNYTICRRDICSCYGGRNDTDCSLPSVLDYARVQSFDNDVIFPYNYICQRDGYSFNNAFNLKVCRGTANYCNARGHRDFASGTLPRIVGESIVSRKVLDEGICVGKTISGYIQTYVEGGVYTPSGCMQNYALVCPVAHGVEIGLLHTDGTKTPFYCKEIKGNCHCNFTVNSGGAYAYYSNYDDYYVGFDRFLHGVHTTSGALSCAGDRIYIDHYLPQQDVCVGFFFCCANQNCWNYYMNCFTMGGYAGTREIVGTNVNGNGVEYNCATYPCNRMRTNQTCGGCEYTTDTGKRFNGIQISLD